MGFILGERGEAWAARRRRWLWALAWCFPSPSTTFYGITRGCGWMYVGRGWIRPIGWLRSLTPSRSSSSSLYSPLPDSPGRRGTATPSSPLASTSTSSEPLSFSISLMHTFLPFDYFMEDCFKEIYSACLHERLLCHFGIVGFIPASP